MTLLCFSIRIRVTPGTHKCHKGKREIRERLSPRFRSTSLKRRKENKD